MNFSRYSTKRNPFEKTNVRLACREARVKESEDKLMLEYKRFNDALKEYQENLKEKDSILNIPNIKEIVNRISIGLDQYNKGLQMRIAASEKVLAKPISNIDNEKEAVENILKENEELKQSIEAAKKENEELDSEFSDSDSVAADNIYRNNEATRRCANAKNKLEMILAEIEKLEKEEKELRENDNNDKTEKIEKDSSDNSSDDQPNYDNLLEELEERRNNLENERKEFEEKQKEETEEIKQLNDKLEQLKIESEKNDQINDEIMNYPIVADTYQSKINDISDSISKIKRDNEKQIKINRLVGDQYEELMNRKRLLKEREIELDKKEKELKNRREEIRKTTEETDKIREEITEKRENINDNELKAHFVELEINSTLKECEKLQVEVDSFYKNKNIDPHYANELKSLLERQPNY